MSLETWTICTWKRLRKKKVRRQRTIDHKPQNNLEVSLVNLRNVF